jgi:hypothetical protein
MYASAMKLSPRFTQEFVEFWDLPEGFRFDG